MSKDKSALIPVSFHGDTLYLIEHNGEPYAAMRPIVEAMGMSWATQTVKLNADKARWGVSIIETPSDGGPQKTLCMPVRKLPAFFANIHPNKVAPALRERIRQYQDECDDALWSYWTQGQATRPAHPGGQGAIKVDAQGNPYVAVLPPPNPLNDPKVRSAINRKAHALSIAAFEHNVATLEDWLGRQSDLSDPDAAIARLHTLDLDHGKHVLVDMQLLFAVTESAHAAASAAEFSLQAIDKAQPTAPGTIEQDNH